jgi:hypothetical protein
MIRLLKTSLILLLGLFLSCSNTGKTGSADQKKTENATAGWVILDKGTQCSINVSSQILIKTPDEFQSEWNRAFSGMGIKPQMPQVDFSKSWVVAAFMGEKNKGGFEVNMASLEEKSDSLVVTISHISPGPNCMSSMAIEYPYIFAEIALLPALKVEIRVKEEIRDCN